MDDQPILVCKKFCFCVPLRHGLLTWGYIKLVWLSLQVVGVPILALMTLFTAVSVHIVDLLPTITIIAVQIIDLVLLILFLIGAHNKNLKLLRLSYYYAIVIWGIIMISVILCAGLLISDYRGSDFWFQFLIGLLLVCWVVSLIIQTVLLLLLRSEIIKLRSNCPYRYIKNGNDAEDIIKCEEKRNKAEKKEINIPYKKECN